MILSYCKILWQNEVIVTGRMRSPTASSVHFIKNTCGQRPHSTKENMQSKNIIQEKVIAVIGPTASGKTSLAIKLAKKFNGELINTDSRQIYKYMNIGTAKGEINIIQNSKFKIQNKYKIINPNIKILDIYDIEGAVIHLVNILEPDKILTLAQYQKLAYAVIEDIIKRGKLPILVGGTGLYIDTITKGYKIPKVKPDKELRKILNNKTVQQLQNILSKINTSKLESLNESDKLNPRRLIRIIEIENSEKDISYKRFKKPQLDTLFLTPFNTRQTLYKRINKRAQIILKSGLIEEVKGLVDKGYKFTKPAMTAISYPIVQEYLDNKITKKELLERFSQGDRNYARRQITWFKRYPAVFVKNNQDVYKTVSEFLRKTIK